MLDRGHRLALLVLGVLTAPVQATDLSAQAQRERGDRVGAGATVLVLDSAALARSHARTLTEALMAQLPGVSVMRASGEVSDGTRVRVRGVSGLDAPLQPILIVDGVHVHAEQANARLDDLPLEMIERVEVLPGAAAAAMYGTNASAGVIRVTSRRGSAGAPRWNLSGEAGLSSDVTAYPANFGAGATTYCTRSGAASGACASTPATSWNPLEEVSPFRTARLGRITARVAGATPMLSYAVSGSAREDQGVLRDDAVSRQSAFARFDLHPFPLFSVQLHGEFVNGQTLRPPADNSGFSALVAGLLGENTDDPVKRGYLYPLSMREQVSSTESLAHGTVGGTVRGALSSWLHWSASHGRDHTSQAEVSTFPFDGREALQRRTNDETTRRSTTGADVRAETSVGAVSGAITLGYERTDRELESASACCGRPAAGSTRTSGDMTGTNGLYAHSRVAWTAGRVLSAGLRRDENDLVESGSASTYPSASALWIISDESFFPRSTGVGTLQVRAAFGEVGDTRSFDRFMFARIGIPGGSMQVDAPRAERTREVEGGIDAASSGNRVRISATAYRKTTTDGFYRTFAPPSLGGSSIIQRNGAVWRTTGLETSLAVRIVERARIGWSLDIGAAAFRNTIDWLGEFPLGFAGLRGNVVGNPIGAFQGHRYTFRDANSDGIIVPAEVIRDTDRSMLGSPVPTRELSLRNRVRIGRQLSVGALLDARGGFKQYDRTEVLRCLSQRCAALYSPGASLEEQADAVAAGAPSAFGSTITGFLHDGDFVRLREVSVTWSLPRRLAARELRVSAIGRNIATWTRYPGLDPELGTSGAASVVQADLTALPLPRTLSIRLDVGGGAP